MVSIRSRARRAVSKVRTVVRRVSKKAKAPAPRAVAARAAVSRAREAAPSVRRQIGRAQVSRAGPSGGPAISPTTGRAISPQAMEAPQRRVSVAQQVQKVKPMEEQRQRTIAQQQQQQAALTRFEQSRVSRGARFVTGRITRAGKFAVLTPIRNIRALPGAARAFVSDPIGTTKQIPRAAVARGKELRVTAREDPARFAGEVAGEALFTKGLGVAGRVGARGTTVAATRVSPSFVPTTSTAISGVRVAGRRTDIPLAGPVSKIAEPVPRQLDVLGTTQNVVTAQRSLFGTVRRRQLVVEKPLPEPGAPQLERALFADPRGRVRVSRLGVAPQREATIGEIFRGQATFRRAQPQVVVFPQQKIAPLPPRLKPIERSLRSGRTLTPSQAKQLEQFQLTPTGQFKGPGFISREPEVVLAPGEVIRRRRTAGVTLIEGRRVPIIEAEVVKTPRVRRAGTGKQPSELAPTRQGRIQRADLSRRAESRPFIPARRIGVTGFTTGLSQVGRGRGKVSAQLTPRPGPRGGIFRPTSPISGLGRAQRGASPLAGPSIISPRGRGTSPRIDPFETTSKRQPKRRPRRMKKARPTRQTGKQPTIFQPSVTGAAFRIRARPRTIKGIGLSPFQIRGIN